MGGEGRREAEREAEEGEGGKTKHTSEKRGEFQPNRRESEREGGERRPKKEGRKKEEEGRRRKEEARGRTHESLTHIHSAGLCVPGRRVNTQRAGKTVTEKETETQAPSPCRETPAGVQAEKS